VRSGPRAFPDISSGHAIRTISTSALPTKARCGSITLAGQDLMRINCRDRMRLGKNRMAEFAEYPDLSMNENRRVVMLALGHACSGNLQVMTNKAALRSTYFGLK
jgi:hypothetical protein